MLKSLSTKFWSNGNIHKTQSSVLKEHINDLFKLCLQLEKKFIDVGPTTQQKIKGNIWNSLKVLKEMILEPA